MPKENKGKNNKEKHIAKTHSNERELAKEKNIERNNKEDFITRITKDRRFFISVCVIILLVGLLIFTACYRRIPKTSKGKQVLATLKGKTITADDLYVELKNENGSNTLIALIDSYIAEKEYPKLTKDDKSYVEEVVKYYKDYAEYYNVDLATFLTNYVGLPNITTEKEFSDYVTKDYKKTLAVRKFIADNASEKELKEYYKENFTDKLTVKHILIEIDKDAEDQDAAKKEAKEKAKSIIATLKDTKAKNLTSKFEELAKENSDDTATYSNGGTIENITKKDVEEAFWNAAYDLKDGEFTTSPVKTSYGYHVILRVSTEKAEKYSKIKDEVKKAYAENILSSDSTAFTKYWGELRKQYKLSIKDDDINKAYKASLNVTDTENEETED